MTFDELWEKEGMDKRDIPGALKLYYKEFAKKFWDVSRNCPKCGKDLKLTHCPNCTK